MSDKGVENPALDLTDDPEYGIQTVPKDLPKKDDSAIVFEDLETGAQRPPWSVYTDKLFDPVQEFCAKHSNQISIAWKILFVILYNVFLVAAIVHHTKNHEEEIRFDQGLGLLISLTIVAYVYVVYSFVLKRTWKWIFQTKTGIKIADKVYRPIETAWQNFKAKQCSSLIVNAVVIIAFLIFMVIDSLDDLKRLRSVFGIFVFVLLGAVCSKYPSKIKWRTITWGLALQFIFGLLILRWPFGRSVFKVLGDQVQGLLTYTDVGSGFVYGYLVNQKPFNLEGVDNSSEVYETMSFINDSGAFNSVFAFRILSVIFFFSFMVSMLFHLGAMQWMIGKIGWMLKVRIFPNFRLNFGFFSLRNTFMATFLCDSVKHIKIVYSAYFFLNL